MDILLIATVIFVTLLVLGYPIINARKYQSAGVPRVNQQLYALENGRVQALDAIRDLQFDHLTGKLSDADYQSLRTQYEFQAAKILQRLDAIKGAPKKADASSHRICRRCHISNDASDKFCVKCGNKLASE